MSTEQLRRFRNVFLFHKDPQGVSQINADFIQGPSSWEESMIGGICPINVE